MDQKTSSWELNIRRPWLVLICLCAAGWAGNYLTAPVLNAEFVFGSVFALLALQIFGWGRGILAAFVIAGYTYLAWNHPWAVITMTAEVFVVGLIIRHTRMKLLMADALYWMIIGLPLGYLCFHILGDFPVNSTIFLMTKQAINGISNALIARLIFAAFALRCDALRFSYRELLFNLLAFFVLSTALIVVIINGKADLQYTDQTIRETLNRDTRQARESLEIWLEERKLPVVQLAEIAQRLPASAMQQRLEQTRASDKNFLRVALIDKNGIATAYAPPVNDQGVSNIGRNYAQRPYIPILKTMRQPMLSEVMLARSTHPGPVAIMLAPVLENGQYAGAVGGIVNFDRIQSALDITSCNESLFYTLLDKNSKIILTNRKDQTVMQPFVRGLGTHHPLAQGITQWIPELPPHTPSIEGWGRSAYVTNVPIGSQKNGI